MLKSDLNKVTITGSVFVIATELEQLLRSARKVFTETSGKEAADRLMNNIWENSKLSKAERVEDIENNILKNPESFKIFVELMGKGGK